MKIKIKYKYDRDRALDLLMDKSAYSDWEKAEADVKITETFIHAAFDDFEGINKVDSIDFAFCIPTRASRFSEEYWEEVYDFVPGLRYLDIDYRFAILSCMPPLKIVSYGQLGQPSHGAVIFVPIFSDMVKDYKNPLFLKREASRRINDAAKLAHERFGAEYIGLGATLPKLTDFGRSIKTKAVTTTGHAGTVWLMEQTFNKVVDRYYEENSALKVGFIGAGSIGVAALERIALANKDHSYHIYDIRAHMNEAAKDKMAEHGVQLQISSSNQDLIRECDVILSAVTSKIDISGISLQGKVIIDDSQPGQFVREEVQEAGGVLVWVVGTDHSKSGFATRRGGYSYGVHGLSHPEDLWGCEAEVAAISNVGKPELAVTDHVSMQDVSNIGTVFQEIGITTAAFQSHGQINDK